MLKRRCDSDMRDSNGEVFFPVAREKHRFLLKRAGMEKDKGF